MKWYLAVLLFHNGVWVLGDNVPGWGRFETPSHKYCLQLKDTAYKTIRGTINDGRIEFFCIGQSTKPSDRPY